MIPEEGYQLIYSLEIPIEPDYKDSRPQYSVDRHQDVDTSFSRVAYYLELDDQYVWVSMDAFTIDRSKIGVPCYSLDCGDGVTRTVFQEVVENVNIVSNVPGLDGAGLTGNIEFWPYDYSENHIDIPGADGSKYDFGDRNGISGWYGSMQVHVHSGGGYVGTVFAFNNFNRQEARPADLGIGNRSIEDPDWTFAANADTYNVRNLKVYTGSASFQCCAVVEFLQEP